MKTQHTNTRTTRWVIRTDFFGSWNTNTRDDNDDRAPAMASTSFTALPRRSALCVRSALVRAAAVAESAATRVCEKAAAKVSAADAEASLSLQRTKEL